MSRFNTRGSESLRAYWRNACGDFAARGGWRHRHHCDRNHRIVLGLRRPLPPQRVKPHVQRLEPGLAGFEEALEVPVALAQPGGVFGFEDVGPGCEAAAVGEFDLDLGALVFVTLEVIQARPGAGGQAEVKDALDHAIGRGNHARVFDADHRRAAVAGEPGRQRGERRGGAHGAHDVIAHQRTVGEAVVGHGISLWGGRVR